MVRKVIAAPSLLMLFLILCLIFCLGVSGGIAGSRTYYDAEGNVISERAYQEMRQRRQKCLESTSDPIGFKRCMDSSDASSGMAPPPSPQPVPDAGAAAAPRRRKPQEQSPPPPPPPAPERTPSTPPPPPRSEPASAADSEPAARPVPSEASTARKMNHPVIPGQREQPVRVIEREIAVPGGGVLKVKEYQYE